MSLKERLKSVDRLLSLAGRSLVDAIYPLECAGCGKTDQIICDRCVAALSILEPPFCRICAAPGLPELCPRCTRTPRHFDGIRAPYHHAGAIRQAIHNFKYDGIRAAAPRLGELMAQFLLNHPLPTDVVTAVPMHPRRLRERGYNQAGLLAHHVAERTGLAEAPTLLQRVRHVNPQAGTAHGAERAANVSGSIALSNEQNISGARILLIDDVATTGSTLDVCAQALKSAGAQSVWGLTLAVAGAPSPAAPV